MQTNYETLQTDYTTLQQAVADISWNDLADIPAGLDDGDDVGLTSVSWDDIVDTANILYDGTDFIFRSLNVRVQSGSGTTDGAVNGLGNLIVGYDEPRFSGSDKTGSHNLVVGPNHNYSNYGGLVAGHENTISGEFSTVSGGSGNTASAWTASVSGGDRKHSLGLALLGKRGNQQHRFGLVLLGKWGIWQLSFEQLRLGERRKYEVSNIAG